LTEQSETDQRPVLVVDFGAQYAQLIARRVREAGVYSEIVPHTASAADIAARNPVGIILSGGPSSVYEDGAPALDTGVFDLGVPTLGISYGFQVMAQALGGEVAHTGLREYGATDAAVTGDGGVLLGGQPAEQNVWMSHGDQVARAPEGFDVLASTGVNLKVVDAREQFLHALAGHTDPETKRKIIGREFIRVFEAAAREVVEEAGAHGEEVKFLVQGTLYPDVVESGGGEGAANIKSHHNVGGLPDDLQFELVEPLRTLFKDEVRAVGLELGVPEAIVWRQPFPGPGLGIRIIGEVTQERLDVLRAADLIAREELTRAGLDREIWQCPVVLLADVRSVGVQGDGRTYGHPVVLRPVSSEDAMTADWTRLPYETLAVISTRITNEVPEVNRVVLDVTSKPPGTIEWE
jgi:GMP synthase (glutamine-hydrolysing) B subunit